MTARISPRVGRRKPEFLGITSRFLAVIVLISVALTVFAQVTPASASSTYHSTCYHTGCHNPSSEVEISADCLECTGASGNPPEAYVSYIVRSQDSNVALTALSVHSTAGSFSVSASQLSNCNYANTCHFRFKGNPITSDLYGSDRYLVSALLTPNAMALGQTASLSGAVSPAAGGQVVYLQRYYSGAWHSQHSYTLSSRSTYRFPMKPTTRGKYIYRITKAGKNGYAAGASPKVVLSVT